MVDVDRLDQMLLSTRGEAGRQQPVTRETFSFLKRKDIHRMRETSWEDLDFTNSREKKGTKTKTKKKKEKKKLDKGIRGWERAREARRKRERKKSNDRIESNKWSESLTTASFSCVLTAAAATCCCCCCCRHRQIATRHKAIPCLLCTVSASIINNSPPPLPIGLTSD